MVRIVKEEKENTVLQEPLKLTEKSKALLQIIGIIIADHSKAIAELLEDYSIEVSETPTEKELTDKLLSAIGECDQEFNNDLAKIILDCTLESTYDNFDVESFFDKGALAGEGGGAASAGTGMWAGIASAVGTIGGVVGQGIKGKQNKDQASATTLQGIYAYKAQLAANAQSQSKSKTNTIMLISLLVLLGFAIVAYMSFMKKPTLLPLPIKA